MPVGRYFSMPKRSPVTNFWIVTATMCEAGVVGGEHVVAARIDEQPRQRGQVRRRRHADELRAVAHLRRHQLAARRPSRPTRRRRSGTAADRAPARASCAPRTRTGVAPPAWIASRQPLRASSGSSAMARMRWVAAAAVRAIVSAPDKSGSRHRSELSEKVNVASTDDGVSALVGPAAEQR